MNKTWYIDFHTYTEAKIEFILAEERNVIKMNKISKTKKWKDNSSGAANTCNNNNKESKQKKNYRHSNTNSIANRKLSAKCTYNRQDGHFTTKCFKNPQVES